MVEFPERRKVLDDDGHPIGWTGEAIELDRESYTISLGGSPDFSPPEQVIELKDTTSISPYILKFERIGIIENE